MATTCNLWLLTLHLVDRRLLCTTAAATALAPPAAIAALAPTAATPAKPQTPTTTPPPSALTLAALVERTAQLEDGAATPLYLATRPSYSIETPDIAYPPAFRGRWRATSRLRSVLAPAGTELFAAGRNGTDALLRARSEIGSPLSYEVRWRQLGDGGPVVVDREYNVASISRATMGRDAVQSVQADGADRLALVLKPSGAAAGALYVADLRVVGRRTDPAEPARPGLFVCAETSRQSVKLAPGERAAAAPPPPRSPLVKEIETICTYELLNGGEVMRGYQRTATYLVPDVAYTSDPSLVELAAQRLARTADGRPVAVDVRLYDLEYQRIG